MDAVISALPDIPDLSVADLPAEDWGDWLFTQLGTALDAAMLRVMQLVVDAVMIPRPEDAGALRAAAEKFLASEAQRDPARFFAFADRRPAPVAVSGRFRRSLSAGVVVAREFTTAYRPYGASVTARGPSNADPILVEHWMHEPERPRGTVLAVHGFSMGQPRIDAIAMFAAQWFDRGLDVALMTLPYHARRSPPDARFSGERFAAPDVMRLSDAVRQAVYEMRLLVLWLREQTGGAPVGLHGLSLGGYLAALLAGLYEDLDFVVSMVPPACIGDLAWRFFIQSRHYRRSTRPLFSYQELRAAYRILSPLTYPLRVPKERVLLIAGRGDRIVPPEHPHALWRHWGQPAIHWFSGSHLAPFGRQKIIGAAIGLLERLGILSG